MLKWQLTALALGPFHHNLKFLHPAFSCLNLGRRVDWRRRRRRERGGSLKPQISLDDDGDCRSSDGAKQTNRREGKKVKLVLVVSLSPQ